MVAARASPAPRKSKSQRPGYIPRPPNAFMLFRVDYLRGAPEVESFRHLAALVEVKQDSSNMTTVQGRLSKTIGSIWDTMTHEDQEFWYRKQEEALCEHSRKYPGYKYQPQKKAHKQAHKQAKGKRSQVDVQLSGVEAIGVSVSPSEQESFASITSTIKLGRNMHPLTVDTRTPKLGFPCNINAAASPSDPDPSGHCHAPTVSEHTAHDSCHTNVYADAEFTSLSEYVSWDKLVNPCYHSMAYDVPFTPIYLNAAPSNNDHHRSLVAPNSPNDHPGPSTCD